MTWTTSSSKEGQTTSGLLICWSGGASSCAGVRSHCSSGGMMTACAGCGVARFVLLRCCRLGACDEIWRSHVLLASTLSLREARADFFFVDGEMCHFNNSTGYSTVASTTDAVVEFSTIQSWARVGLLYTTVVSWYNIVIRREVFCETWLRLWCCFCVFILLTLTGKPRVNSADMGVHGWPSCRLSQRVCTVFIWGVFWRVGV